MRRQERTTALIGGLALLALLGCRNDHVELDEAGRALLAPRRAQAIHPDELIGSLGLPETAVVADVGAGPGFLTLPLARAVSSGRVVATDVNARYLDALSQRARAAGIHNIETRVVAPERPGLEDASFDLILLCQVDHYLSDRATYFAALKRALRPGGRIVIVNYQQYREADLAAARNASLQIVDTWTPSNVVFVMLLKESSPR